MTDADLEALVRGGNLGSEHPGLAPGHGRMAALRPGQCPSIRRAPAQARPPPPAGLVLCAPQSAPISQDLMRFEIEKKSEGVALLLCWVAGMFGGHRLYLRRPHAVTMLVITLVSNPLCFFCFGFFGILVTWIWMIADLFQVSRWAREYNTAVWQVFSPASPHRRHEPRLLGILSPATSKTSSFFNWHWKARPCQNGAGALSRPRTPGKRRADRSGNGHSPARWWRQPFQPPQTGRQRLVAAKTPYAVRDRRPDQRLRRPDDAQLQRRHLFPNRWRLILIAVGSVKTA